MTPPNKKPLDPLLKTPSSQKTTESKDPNNDYNQCGTAMSCKMQIMNSGPCGFFLAKRSIEHLQAQTMTNDKASQKAEGSHRY